MARREYFFVFGCVYVEYPFFNDNLAVHASVSSFHVLTVTIIHSHFGNYLFLFPYFSQLKQDLFLFLRFVYSYIEIYTLGLQIKCFMQQLLCGLDHCHSHGILHRDIKGSNLLIDQNGNLKIGDFGLATFFNQKQPLTSRVVTLWYRPPELLLGATDYGVSVDLWSTGCILAELFAGKPIMPGRTEVRFFFFLIFLLDFKKYASALH